MKSEGTGIEMHFFRQTKVNTLFSALISLLIPDSLKPLL
jgi:hypothetical protein